MVIFYHQRLFAGISVLPSSRIFGPITQKDPIKGRAAGQICGQILADFIQKGPKNRQNFWKVYFPTLLTVYLITGMPKNYNTFPSDKDSFVSKGKNCQW
jgi:hypothetical protein